MLANEKAKKKKKGREKSTKILAESMSTLLLSKAHIVLPRLKKKSLRSKTDASAVR